MLGEGICPSFPPPQVMPMFSCEYFESLHTDYCFPKPKLLPVPVAARSKV